MERSKLTKDTRDLAIQLAVKMYPEYVRDMCLFAGYAISVADVISIERVGRLSELPHDINDVASRYIRCWRIIIATLKRSSVISSVELLDVLVKVLSSELRLAGSSKWSVLKKICLHFISQPTVRLGNTVNFTNIDIDTQLSRDDWVVVYLILCGLSVHEGKAAYSLKSTSEEQSDTKQARKMNLPRLERDPRLVAILEDYNAG